MRLIGLAVVLLALAAGAWYALADAPAPEVDTALAERGDIVRTLTLTGTVVNDFTVTLTALLDGQLEAIHAREGDAVAANTVLAELDDRAAVATLERARAGVDLQTRTLTLAQARHERMNRMSAGGDESRQALDDARLAMDQADANLRVARADRALAELQLENAAVRAPYAGTVIEQAVETGQWVEAGTRLFTLVADAGRVIEVQVDAADHALLALEQTARLQRGELAWSSNVVRIANSVTRTDGSPGNTFAVRVGLDADAPSLLLGQQIDVDLEIDRASAVIRVPLAAVVEPAASADGGGASPFVWRLEGGRLVRQDVELGLRDAVTVEVSSGLDDGTRVALPGVGFALRAGLEVRAAER